MTTTLVRRARSALVGIRDFWIDHRWLDAAVTLTIVGVYTLVTHHFGRFDVLAWLTPGDRRAMYSAFAVVVSLTGAMGGVAVSQLGSAKGERVLALKRHGGRELAKNWRSTYLGAFSCAMLALLALALDGSIPAAQGHNAFVGRMCFDVAVVLASMKFLRLSVLFQPLIIATVLDDTEEPNAVAPAPTLDRAEFQRRAG